MAGLKMSFMDALRVAAQTKDAPKEWSLQDNFNAPSWPASLQELARSSSLPRKRSRDDREGTSTNSISTPSTPVSSARPPPLHGHLPIPIPTPPTLHSKPWHPGLTSHSGTVTPVKTPTRFEPIQRTNSTPAPCPASTPPTSKRPKPVDQDWISRVAGSIRGPWTGERSTAEDAVVSHLLPRIPSHFENLGGSSNELADAIKAKLKENLLQRVFENQQVLHNTLSSLPEIMQWGSTLLHSRATGTPEASHIRSQTDSRKVLSPTTSSGDSNNHCDTHSLLSSSAIQKCLSAVPPSRSTIQSSFGSLKPSMNQAGPADAQRKPPVQFSGDQPLEGLLSSSAIAKCLAAAPPAAPQKLPSAQERSRIEAYNGALEWFSSSQDSPQTCSQELVNPNENMPSVQPASIHKQQPACSQAGEYPKSNLGFTGGFSDQGVGESWETLAPTSQNDDGLWLQAPFAEANRGDEASGGKAVHGDEDQKVLDVAAACMRSLTQLVGEGRKTPPPRGTCTSPAVETQQETMREQQQQKGQGNKPVPLLIDTEALASICPEAVSNILGGKSPMGEFNWEGDLPTPKIALDGEDDIWAEAFKIELPSPNMGGGGAW